MPVAMLMEIPGVTAEQYDGVMQDLQLESMPEGGIIHVAAPMEGGWRVLDVWQTREQFERFYEERIAAAFEKNGVHMSEPPKFQELHNVMSVEHAPVAAG